MPSNIIPGWRGGKLMLDLADFLESDPRVEGHFDMRAVLKHKDWSALRLTRRGRPDLHTCGTAACAIGWAPHVPSIRRAGLRYIRLDTTGDWWISLHGEVCGFRSAARFLFDIDDPTINRLFNPQSGRSGSPRQVARNIRRFVKAEAKRRAKEDN